MKRGKVFYNYQFSEFFGQSTVIDDTYFSKLTIYGIRRSF